MTATDRDFEALRRRYRTNEVENNTKKNARIAELEASLREKDARIEELQGMVANAAKIIGAFLSPEPTEGAES